MSHNFQMKSIAGLVFVTLLAGLVLTAGAYAQDKKDNGAATASGGYKIAVVDMQKLLADSNKRKQKYDALQKEVDEMQASIEVMAKKIEADKKAYDEKKDTMTDEERSAKKNDITNAITTYQAEMKKRQSTIDSREETVLKEVFADIQGAIAKISEKEGYHLVLNSIGGPRGNVMYHSATLDITSQVLAAING